MQECSEVVLSFRPAAPADLAKVPAHPLNGDSDRGMTVSLRLDACDEWVPWELVLDAETMLLRECPADALGARSERIWEHLCCCVGMSVLAVFFFSLPLGGDLSRHFPGSVAAKFIVLNALLAALPGLADGFAHPFPALF